MEFLKSPTRNLFFTGKGGVGKTSVACATAVRLADAGKRVLLVSTDPASNLDEVLGTPLQHHPTPVPSIPNLSAMNLDPEKSAADYRERMVGPYRALLPAAVSRRRRRTLRSSRSHHRRSHRYRSRPPTSRRRGRLTSRRCPSLRCSRRLSPAP